MAVVDKNRPTHEWIEHLRKRYPCEKEIDRVLTRKLQRRAGPPYTPLSLETLIQGTEALIRSQHAGPFTITNASWLSGGASKLQMAFTLDWNQPASARPKLRWCCAWNPRNRSSKPAASANSK